MSKYSSDSVGFESEDSRIESSLELKDKKSSSIRLFAIAVAGCLVVIVGMFGLAFTAIVGFTLYDKSVTNPSVLSEEGTADGMKKVLFNRVTYNEDKSISDVESNFMLLDEGENDYSRFQVTPVENTNEVFFITEEPMYVECEVSCCCYNYEEDGRRGLCSGGSCTSPKCWIGIGIAVTVLVVGGIICSKKCCKKCGEKCKEKGYDTGEAGEIQCVEPTQELPEPKA